MESYYICSFVTGLFYLPWYPQGSPMLKHLIVFPSFLRLNIIPFFVWTASYLSVHPWTDTWLAVGSVCCEHRWADSSLSPALALTFFFFFPPSSACICLPTWVRALSGHVLCPCMGCKVSAPHPPTESRVLYARALTPLPLGWKNCRGMSPSSPGVPWWCWTPGVCLADLLMFRPALASFLGSVPHSPTLASWDYFPRKLLLVSG